VRGVLSKPFFWTILFERNDGVFVRDVLPKPFFWTIIAVFNILFAWVVISDPIHVINTDGVLYLQTAKAYALGGWQAAVHLYPWPFYAILIASIAKIFPASLEQTAYALNIFFQVLISVGFFNLACKISGWPFLPSLSTRQREWDRGLEREKWQWMGLITLLILCFPTLNQYRGLIIRDFGYWALSLWGWLYLIQLAEKGRIYQGIQFGIAMLLASLFRLEAIVMLLLGPFALFGCKQKLWVERLNLFIKAHSVTLFGSVIFIIYWLTHASSIENFGRLLEVKHQMDSGLHLILQNFLQAKQLLSSALPQVSVDSASSLLIGGLMVLYLNTLLITLTPFYTFLTGLCVWKKKFTPIALAKPILWTAIFLNVCVTMLFTFQSLFLAGRYIFDLCLLFLLWVPFLLFWLYKETAYRKSWTFWSVLVVMVTLGMLSLHNFGPSKIYWKQAGAWLHQNIPPNELVYTNNPQLSFYADRANMTYERSTSTHHVASLIENAKRSGHRYFAFQVNQNNVWLKNQLTQQLGNPLKSFANEKGDVIWIYRS
jgi:hypothetical protein